MTRNFRRSLTAAAGVLALGTALVACSPPHENDSEKKVDTATSAAAPQVADSQSSNGKRCSLYLRPGYRIRQRSYHRGFC
ncbi:hypothetical protein O7744_03675 [Corynebacterium pseudotuberculosis]